MTQPSIDSALFRQVLGSYPTGVSVVTATGSDGQPVGMVVGTFTSVFLAAPMLMYLGVGEGRAEVKDEPAMDSSAATKAGF